MPRKPPPNTDCHKIVTRLKPLIDLSGGIRRDIRQGIRLFVRRSTNAPCDLPRHTGARDPSVFARPPPPTENWFLRFVPFAYIIL